LQDLKREGILQSISEQLIMHVVSTMGGGDLQRELDLDSVIESLNKEFGIEFDRHSDSMVTIRTDTEGSALTLYRTGTYQIRGAESREALFNANENLLNTLRAIGVEFSESDFEQKNAVYLEDYETNVRLETLAVHLGLENVEYDPEHFSGLIYRSPKIGTVNLVFSSGKAIINGTIYDEVAEKSSEYLREQISNILN